jgi:hypothetical protein
MSDVLAALSAALMVWGIGAASFGLWRLYEARNGDPRRNILLAGAVLIAIGLAMHQGMAWHAWEMGTWRGSSMPPVLTIGYRLAWGAGLLALAGAASWPRCGHRGWQALLVLGVGAWLVAWAI